MKHEQIKERCTYQVSMGGDKKAVLRVVQFNPKTNSWTCKSEAGKDVTVKDPKRFLKEMKPKDEAVKEAPRKGPVPREKTPKEKEDAAPKPEPKISPEEVERLLENVRKTASTLKVAEEAIENGLTINPKELDRIKREAEDAKDAAAEAGVSSKSGGRSNGMMSGKDAALRVLQEEGKPMRARELCDLAHRRGYCDMPGKTPWSTIAAALSTDINEKGENSRFKKVGPGLFAVNEKYKEH